MKLRQILCSILIFLYCSNAFAAGSTTTAKPAGIELCSEVHSFLKKNDFSPSAQSLVVSGENAFPYNIIVNFSPEQNTSPENLILVFFQEDIHENQDIIKDSLNKIRDANYPFTVTALFAYGEKQVLEKADMIYGTEVFLEGLNTNLSYTAVIFDLESAVNEVETTSERLSSPPRLIKNSMNLYLDNGLASTLPPFVLSQLSSYKFISCAILSRFFEYDIPTIKLSLGNIEPEQKKQVSENIITGSAELFSKDADTSWEHHFMIIKLFGSYHTISERLIIHIVIPTIFLWLLFIFSLVFVNRRLKKHTWSTIGKIWWSVPLTYLLLFAGFFLGGILFRNISGDFSYAAKIYGQLIFQISISLFLVLSAYLIILTLNGRFTERSVDYLLVVSCFINQSIFILADISLSPIFITICLLSLLALSVKNNYLHIAVFLLMIVPLVPYANRMINAADLKSLADFLAKSKVTTAVIPLVLYPVYIVLFRIITSFRSTYKKISLVIISTASAFVIITLALTTFGILRIKSLNKKQVQPYEITIDPHGHELIEFSVKDRNVFDDIIRTMEVSLKKDCIICDILITTDNTNPILYSDNDYTNPSANQARFSIPNNPPKEMTFSYGAAKVPCRITVSAVYQNPDNGSFQFISNSLETGAN